MKLSVRTYSTVILLGLGSMLHAKGNETDNVIKDFSVHIESIHYLSRAAINEDSIYFNKEISNIGNSKDPGGYVETNQLELVLKAHQDSLEFYRENVTAMAQKFVADYGKKIQDVAACEEDIKSVVRNRLRQRASLIDNFEEVITASKTERSTAQEETGAPLSLSVTSALWGLFSCAVIIILIAWLIWQKNRKTKETPAAQAKEEAPTIIVRRKTTAILKTQSVDDIIDNPSYYAINCEEFCDDSAVRRIYVKNTCIIDIYNMYLNDLCDTENPKENGCMVLGRWVFDSDADEYYVSLEYVVLPGDDAVFSEYELNFGGKIKLLVSDRLRKLRRETNLQYDLTCWVHSHPGLTVFFSNSDSNVQMQLKHPTHPRFLTAIVVDNMTKGMETGIFTFKRDTTINADLKRLYSLEELYQWAVKSERESFKPKDHFNTLAEAPSKTDDLAGIELSKKSIVCIHKLIAEKEKDYCGFVYGFTSSSGLKREFVANTVDGAKDAAEDSLIGCFVITTHCSIPSVRKLIAEHLDSIHFVLVYSSTDGMLTSIPVAEQVLCIDNKYYGEQKMDELMLWVQTKR